MSAAGPAVGVLLVTHGKLGHLLLETMSDMLGPLPMACDVLEVRRVQATEVLLRQGARMIERLDAGAGVLMLTDAYGSTPANIANKLAIGTPTLVVAGVNLPMLVRVFNYPTLSLDVMARAAVEGGQKGVTLCPRASI
ncbi:PTS system, ascorbate-specific IIA component [Hydrocarboniphaga daqingensis]|uniref:PTS system, ascorbate-specific IIA component n=1 Tax=Hydrocarboniphaga daqingensis TaxID=490188 RepID=A0A1M5R6E1_9GAMM|nr:PTS fructose transporter subunit IIA [Hydrocarboniphaga daqingensis]SHH21798.1 PTS system, ascorbate-specific IIA component [Hydrocarboniphaga daqingensis]